MSEKPDTPTGWALASLTDVCSLNPPLATPVKDDNSEVGFVPMAAVDEEFGGVQRPERRVYGQVKKGYTPFQTGDVIMAKITPCMENGKGGVVIGPSNGIFFGSTEFHVFRPANQMPASWIAYYLSQHSVRHAARIKMKGSAGQLRVPAEFLHSLKLPVAPLSEQSRIADRIDELFTDLFAGVAALERVKKKLKRYRSAVLHAAVTGKLTAQWRKEHGPPIESGNALLKRILIERRKQWEARTFAKYEQDGRKPPKNWRERYPLPVEPKTEGLPELPEGWCWASVDQCANVQGGLQKSPARTPQKNHYPYLRVANVLRGRLDLDDLSRFELSRDELIKLRLEIGDLLIVEGNGSLSEIGRSALWTGEIADCVHQNHIIRCRFTKQIVPEYADAFVNSPLGQTYMREVASSTSGLHTLSVGKVKSIVISLAPGDEQVAIVELVQEKLSQIDAMESEVERGLACASCLRQAILKSAFAGKLVPQDPNDEPAAVLLERIRAERAKQQSPGNGGPKRATRRKKTTPRKAKRKQR